MLSLVEAPQNEPVSVDRVKRHIGVFGSAQDEFIGALIAAARERVENTCERAFVAATWQKRVAAFGSSIRLYRSPIESIGEITYRGVDGVRVPLSLASVMLREVAGEIVPINGGSFPDGTDVIVTFTTAPEELIPSAVKAAICMIAADLYNNREESIVGTIRADNPAVLNLLAPYMLGDRV